MDKNWMHLKKRSKLLILGSIACALLAGCGGGSGGESSTPASSTLSGVAGTYNLIASDGTTASVTFNSSGSVTSCAVSTVVVCSGNLTLNSTNGTVSFQISGNDGLNPVDTTANLSGIISTDGSVTGSYSGNSIINGAFSGTFTGSKAGGTGATGSVTPTITGMSPSAGAAGTVVTITGSNFSPTLANNTVRFNGTLATVTAATTTSLTVIVPSGATDGTITVTTAAGSSSSATSFTVSVAAAINTLTLSTPINGVSNLNLGAPTFSQTVGSAYAYVINSINWSAVGTGSAYDGIGVNETVDPVYNYTGISMDIQFGGGRWSLFFCGISGNFTGYPTCASLGITFDKMAGTLSLQNSPIPISTILGAPATENFTGTLHFTPY